MKLDSFLLNKLENYCFYSERCLVDVQKKATDLGIAPKDLSFYIAHLEEHKFLNEKRYAESYVKAHLKKKWGVRKIKQRLQFKKISPELIALFLKEKDEKEYEESIQILAAKKLKFLRKGTPAEKKQKIIAYLLQKGYEMEDIKKAFVGLVF